ncbi:MAG: hypothetical protein ACRD2I_05310 [Vicinamibacterales bacterium]
MKAFTAVVLAIALFAAGGVRAFAQTDFSGAWAIDRDISSDLSKATFEPGPTQTRRSGSGIGGSFGRRGFGGRNGAGAGRQPGTDASRGARGTALTDEEKARLRDVALYVKGLASIVIDHTDHSTFTVTDALGRSHLYMTDGTKAAQAFGTTTIDAVTKWDGAHMVTDFTIGPAHDLIFTYILVPATRQLALRIQLDDAGRARADVPEVKLVYKLKPAPPPAALVAPH